ncbi:MAG: IS200/IS605 family transposase [Bradymonadaceae bacterium]
MASHFTKIYIHLVWRTKDNRRTLTGDLAQFVETKLHEYGRKRDLEPLAIGPAYNHVHAYYEWDVKVAVADTVRALKSKTTVKWNKPVRNGERDGPLLEWQTGYGAVSTRRSDVEVVRAYVDNQDERHRRDETWAPFEQLTETKGAAE